MLNKYFYKINYTPKHISILLINQEFKKRYNIYHYEIILMGRLFE
jgi:hypothetical protein